MGPEFVHNYWISRRGEQSSDNFLSKTIQSLLRCVIEFVTHTLSESADMWIKVEKFSGIIRLVSFQLIREEVGSFLSDVGFLAMICAMRHSWFCIRWRVFLDTFV